VARKAPTANLSERLFNLLLSVDYDQPTSLEGDMDFLADGIIEFGICPASADIDSKEGYLSEVLRAIPGRQEELKDALESLAGIDEILSRMDYGQLRKADAKRLENLLNDMVSELENFFA
jgi:hypothetical protein